MNAPRINRYPITIDGEPFQVGTANELAIALDVLQGQYDNEVLCQLQPHLAEIIAHANGLMTVLRSLSPDDQLFLIQAIGSHLVDVTQNAAHLRDILAILPEQRVKEMLITTLGASGLRHLIMVAEELAEVLEWVYGECDAMILDLLGEPYLRRLCRHVSSLSAILCNLDFSLQAQLLEQLGWPCILNLVKDGKDLAYLLRALPPVNSEQLLHHFSGQQLIDLIRNAEDWAYLYRRLEPAEADLLLSSLHNR